MTTHDAEADDPGLSIPVMLGLDPSIACGHIAALRIDHDA
jgi:hypothetical protein